VIAHRPGTVTQLFVKAGDVVEAGQRLLTIA
jgi:biotin carboxyl carrier protein